MGKLFKNSGEVSDTAQLARETVQNSWDAATAFRASNLAVPFRMRFRFVDVIAEEKQRLISDLDLRGLAERRSVFAKSPVLDGTILDHLDDETPMRLLYVEDFGTHGLYGHPDLGTRSHLFLAMYYIGGSDKTPGSGGSYGFGKSALERASRVHSVVAHSVFEQQEDPYDDETSRLVGFTWWPGHRSESDSYQGRAIFGASSGAGPGPVEGARSYELAEGLGFAERSPIEADELGTGFLVVDPAIDPEDLVVELEKWWWPALHEHAFEIEVVTADGRVLIPRPADNPFVSQFLPAYRIAIGQDEPSDPNRSRRPSDNWRARGSASANLGALGLHVPDRALQEDGSDAEGEALVALMRSPRMVIKYLKYGRARVALRGAFVASEDANALLRQTEPALHETWSTNRSSDVDPEATQKAKAILDRIRSSIRKMAEEVAPPPPKDNRALTHFSKLMSGFLGDKVGPFSPIPPGGEPIELKLTKRPRPEIEGNDSVVLTAAFTVSVLGSAPGQSCMAVVACKLYIQEDDRAGSRWPVSIEPSDETAGFVLNEDGEWEGVIEQGKRQEFSVASSPYSNAWTTRLVPTVTRVGEWVSA